MIIFELVSGTDLASRYRFALLHSVAIIPEHWSLGKVRLDPTVCQKPLSETQTIPHLRGLQCFTALSLTFPFPRHC